jgi:hypothetical protein
MDSMERSLGLPHNFLQEFVAFFGDTLIEKTNARQWASHVLETLSQEHVEKRLDRLLKGYTVDLASKPLSSWTSLSKQSHQVLIGATGLLRRYRSEVIQYFIANAVLATVNAMSLSARLQTLGQQLSLTERFGLLAKGRTNEPDPEETSLRTGAPLETTDEDDEEEVKLFTELEPIRDMLVSSDVFSRLVLEIRRLSRDNDCEEHIQSTLQGSVEFECCDILMDWPLADFMSCQYGSISSVGEVIVVTGSALYAQCTTCEDYITETWPYFEDSTFLVQALDTFLAKSRSTSSTADAKITHRSGYTTVDIDITPAGSMKFRVTSRAMNRLITVAQQLAWMRSAISISPFGDPGAYARPILTVCSRKEVVITIHHSPIKAAEKVCWLPLFPGVVVASGFSIPLRGDEIGLDISLTLLAGIGGVQHAVEFQGGVVMKGFSHMFVPVQKVGDRIQWHAVSSADADTPLTYHDGLAQCTTRAYLDEVSLEDIRRCRAIVGWCSLAQSRLGSDAINYENIHYSAATDINSSTRCAGASLGFQQFGTAALDFKFGVREGKCHFKRDGPFRNIVSWAEKTPIVLYDTAERRGWLVPASDVLLHILQCRHRLEPFEVAGKRIALDTTVPINASAKDVLLKNASLMLSDDDNHTFKTEIAGIWSLLDFLISENVAREQNSHGATVKSTWNDVLHGFEFNAVVEQHSPFRQKQTKLFNTHGGWPLLSRDIDALVLLANGFEDIIVPAADHVNKDLCGSWQRVPKANDYLATSTPMLKKLYDRAGCPLDRKYLTSSSKQLQWHQGNSKLFEPCENLHLRRCQCDRLQQILSQPVLGSVIGPDCIDNEGAVIFGRSETLMQEMVAKPRARAPKSFGIYSQQNAQLTPIVIQQESEDTSFSDGDASGPVGSDFTLDSMSGTLLTCTTASSQTAVSHFDDVSTISTHCSLSKKRGRFPDAFEIRTEEPDEPVKVEHKRFKSEIAHNAVQSPKSNSNGRSPPLETHDHSRQRLRPTHNEPDSDDKHKAWVQNLPHHHAYLSETDINSFPTKHGDTALPISLDRVDSQRMLRRQPGFYQRVGTNG